MISFDIVIFIVLIDMIILVFSIYDEYIAKHLAVYKKNMFKIKSTLKHHSLTKNRNYFLLKEGSYILRKKILDNEKEKLRATIGKEDFINKTFFLKFEGFNDE